MVKLFHTFMGKKKKKKKRCGCGEREQLQFPEDKKQLHSFFYVILSGRKDWLHFCTPAVPRDGPSCPLCCVALTWHRFGTGALIPGNWGRRMPNGGEREDELLENMALIKPNLALGRVGEMLQISPAS